MMRTDIHKLDYVDAAMGLNDSVYGQMSDEADNLTDVIETEHGDVKANLDELYFYKRVLSVISNYDLPFKAAIGYYELVNSLEMLYENRDGYIGDSDTDEDIFRYVLEYGYMLYDRLAKPFEDEYDVYKRVMEREGGDV